MLFPCLNPDPEVEAGSGSEALMTLSPGTKGGRASRAQGHAPAFKSRLLQLIGRTLRQSTEPQPIAARLTLRFRVAP